MMLDELMAEQRVASIRRVDSLRLMLEDEARAAHRGGLRRWLARMLVRAGLLLDRGSVERVAGVRGGPVAHNGRGGDDGLAWHLR